MRGAGHVARMGERERRRRLHNEELYNLYASSNITRVIKSKETMGGTWGTHGRDEKYIQSFGRKT
jgi:hypothetical protein